MSEVLGLSGAALAGYAYIPQIAHLVHERCSAGLSERAFALWLLASLLITIHAVAIGATVFVLLGIQQIVATGLIVFYGRLYRGRVCPSHETAARYGAARRDGGDGSGWRSPAEADTAAQGSAASLSRKPRW